jgi:hypothetical protein
MKKKRLLKQLLPLLAIMICLTVIFFISSPSAKFNSGVCLKVPMGSAGYSEFQRGESHYYQITDVEPYHYKLDMIYQTLKGVELNREEVRFPVKFLDEMAYIIDCPKK